LKPEVSIESATHTVQNVNNVFDLIAFYIKKQAYRPNGKVIKILFNVFFTNESASVNISCLKVLEELVRQYSTEEWTDFMSEWTDYLVATHLKFKLQVAHFISFNDRLNELLVHILLAILQWKSLEEGLLQVEKMELSELMLKIEYIQFLGPSIRKSRSKWSKVFFNRFGKINDSTMIDLEKTRLKHILLRLHTLVHL
jgi:hypothetical protein